MTETSSNWPSPYAIEQAPIYVPETLYDPEVELPHDVEVGLGSTTGHYLSGYAGKDRVGLYLHDVAYWRIVTEHDGNIEAANQFIEQQRSNFSDDTSR